MNIDDNVGTFQIIRQAASHVVKFTRKKKRFVIFEFERLFCWYKNSAQYFFNLIDIGGGGGGEN